MLLYKAATGLDSLHLTGIGKLHISWIHMTHEPVLRQENARLSVRPQHIENKTGRLPDEGNSSVAPPGNAPLKTDPISTSEPGQIPVPLPMRP